MHTYSIDSQERRNIFIFLITLGIITAIFVSQRLPQTELISQLKLLIDPTSPLFFISIFWLIFDRILWKKFARLRLIQTPNLNGKYKGKLKSSFSDSEHIINLSITQTWSKISIRLTTKQSKSKSYNAFMSVENSNSISLTYLYENNPLDTNINMKHHKGTIRLDFDNKLINGWYYTDRNRDNNFGSVTLKKMS